MKNLFVALIVAVGLSACGHTSPGIGYDKQLMVADPGVKSQRGDPNTIERIDEPVGNADIVATKEPPALQSSSTTNTADTVKKIIKEGNISFEAFNITDTRKKVLGALRKLGGYVYDDSESLNSDDNRKEFTLKTRIPAKFFDAFLDSVASGAKQIDSKNIQIKDVTTQFIDMSTRLDHKKLLEGRYIQLLKQASKMSDILEVENKLNEIRTDIESTQGQLNYLSKQVAYSSLDITFYSKAKPANSVAQTSRFKKALSRGWAFVLRFFFDVIACWPIVIIALALFIWYKSRKKRDGVTVV